MSQSNKGSETVPHEEQSPSIYPVLKDTESKDISGMSITSTFPKNFSFGINVLQLTIRIHIKKDNNLFIAKII